MRNRPFRRLNRGWVNSDHVRPQALQSSALGVAPSSSVVRTGKPKARLIALGLGIVEGGYFGFYHGYNEAIQGNVPTPGFLFCAVPPPGNCSPAVSLLPTFLLAGSVTILITIAFLAWLVLGFWRAPSTSLRAPLILFLFSTVLLLSGGGGLGPVLGWIGSGVAHRGAVLARRAVSSIQPKS